MGVVAGQSLLVRAVGIHHVYLKVPVTVRLERNPAGRSYFLFFFHRRKD